jgi:hypothetical protein
MSETKTPRNDEKSRIWIDPVVHELERLRAELAAAREALRWIPVEERLPESGQWVMACWPYNNQRPQVIKYTEASTQSRRYGFWSIDEEHFEPPTHWMPLPAPPVLHAQREGE